MEYQQFINFLKKEGEYDFFMMLVDKHLHESFRKGLSIKELYENDNPFIRDIFICTILEISEINEHYGITTLERVCNLHLKWYDYYHGE